MTTQPTETKSPPTKRIVLVDFDWEDADLVPEILRSPGLAVRLVAGATTDDAGVRVAELCGLPRTVEIADLTREIFDLALVGERSPRRAQVERLFGTLGTPTRSPSEFLRADGRELRRAAERAAAPCEARPPAVRPEPAGPAEPVAVHHGTLPDPADLPALERLLEAWTREAGAAGGEIHFAEGAALRRACRTGGEDVLLAALVDLAHRLDAPQVVNRVGGSEPDRVWGAWPLRTSGRRAVLAVASAAPGSAGEWARRAEALRLAWQARERDADGSGAAAVPPLPVDAFLHRLELAVERNRTEGYRFALHRIRFEAAATLDHLMRELPGQLRASDSLCRHGDREVLLMCPGPANAWVHVRRRIVTLWERAWRDSGRRDPAPPIADERVEMADPEEARSFLSAAHAWLAGA